MFFNERENEEGLQSTFTDEVHYGHTYQFLFNNLIKILEQDYQIKFTREIWNNKIQTIEFQKEIYFIISILDQNATHDFYVENFDFSNIQTSNWYL